MSNPGLRLETGSLKGAGVLLHPTSLQGPWGVGTLGDETAAFLDWLREAGFTWWQVLPMNPTGFGNSPYQPLSSFAGNPLLVSPGVLHRMGLLTAGELSGAGMPASGTVRWNALLPERLKLVSLAAERALGAGLEGFDDFCGASSSWLDPWARYAALKEEAGGATWREWGSRSPDPRREDVHRMVQYLFGNQWNSVLEHCSRLGIRVLGDLPIYCSLDSSDVWSAPELFLLDQRGEPLCVAGVPPDYFSSTGQLWGNPLYRWSAHRAGDYRWWAGRIGRMLEVFHGIRIDHFRGFCDYWEVPAGSSTARSGAWRKGPGRELFDRVRESLGGSLPIVAEDLGIITPEVARLRRDLGFPGMTVLQFALEDGSFDPARLPRDTVLYTGTHDNDTTAGWAEGAGSRLGLTLDRVIGIALDSPADMVIFPAQDLLGLGSDCRMNTPGTCADVNWSFRLPKGSLSIREAGRWRRLLASRRGA
jgi:4-alpha-glucanotransferase